MRVTIAAAMLILLAPAAAVAQSAPPPAAKTAAAAPAAPRRGADITRDEYIERAKQNAARRFDRMDADHNGVLTEAERHAYREAHHRVRKAAAH